MPDPIRLSPLPDHDSEHDAAPSPLATAPAEPDDVRERAFRAFVGAAARDQATRACFAAILDAQGLAPDESEAIWRSFLAAADEATDKAPPPSVLPKPEV